VFLVGLTGGIGSGKTSVSERLAARGAAVVDAERITRALQEPGQPVFEQMVERFGPGIVAEDGRLDRQAVADIVFTDAAAKADLEAIVHPAVGIGIAEELGRLSGTDALVVLDIPLLVEKGRDDLLGVIVVDVDPEVAVDRLVRFRGFREDDARARIANQADRATRLAKADFVVDNSGDLAALDAEVDRCWAWLQELVGGATAGSSPAVDR
jgi:dephospho-CoA kinase